MTSGRPVQEAVRGAGRPRGRKTDFAGLIRVWWRRLYETPKEDNCHENISGMDFLVDLLATLIAEAGLEFGLAAFFKLSHVAIDLRTDSVQTLFSRHRLD